MQEQLRPTELRESPEILESSKKVETRKEEEYSIHKLLSGRPLSIPGQVDDSNHPAKRFAQDSGENGAPE